MPMSVMLFSIIICWLLSYMSKVDFQRDLYVTLQMELVYLHSSSTAAANNPSVSWAHWDWLKNSLFRFGSENKLGSDSFERLAHKWFVLENELVAKIWEAWFGSIKLCLELIQAGPEQLLLAPLELEQSWYMLNLAKQPHTSLSSARLHLYIYLLLLPSISPFLFGSNLSVFMVLKAALGLHLDMLNGTPSILKDFLMRYCHP